MCGISGWFVRKGVDWRPSKELVCKLLTGIEMRGWDATGYGTIQDNGELFVYKGAVSCWKFKTEFMKENLHIGPVGILHTRGANVGDPKNNANNHPVSYENTKRSVIVTHNGTVGNLDEAYDKLGVQPEADVDSALIAASLGARGPVDGIRFLEKTSCGSAAFAALFGDGSLMLARDVSPVFIAQPQDGVLIWSSEVEPMKAVSEHTNEFGMPMWKIWGMADSKFYYWGADGKLVDNGTFRLPAMYKSPSYLRDKSSATTQQKVSAPAVTPSQAALPISGTELAKRMGFMPALPTPNPAAVIPDSYDPPNKIKMDAARHVHCNWAGCWKKSNYRVYWHNQRWIPLCQKHTNKFEKKGHELVLSDQHEMSRKTVAILA